MTISIHKPIFIRVSYQFWRLIWLIKSVFMVLAAFICAGAVGIAYFEKLPMGDAFYFAVITGLTVGYGDITPQTPGGRLIAVMIALIGVIFSGLVVAAALRAVSESRKHIKKP